MSEQFQSPAPERHTTEFETGDFIALHESELASFAVGRARAEAAAAFQLSQEAEQRPQTEIEKIQARGRHLMEMRRHEVDLAA